MSRGSSRYRRHGARFCGCAGRSSRGRRTPRCGSSSRGRGDLGRNRAGEVDRRRRLRIPWRAHGRHALDLRPRAREALARRPARVRGGTGRHPGRQWNHGARDQARPAAAGPRRPSRPRLRCGAPGGRLGAGGAAPLGRSVVGILNVESERALPDGAAEALRPLARGLGPLAEALRASRTLDLAALARLFVHLGSMREPRDIAALGAASLPKILPVEASHIVVWEDLARPRARGLEGRRRLTPRSHARRDRARAHADRSERRLSGAGREHELHGSRGRSCGSRSAPMPARSAPSSASIATRLTWIPLSSTRLWSSRPTSQLPPMAPSPCSASGGAP